MIKLPDFSKCVETKQLLLCMGITEIQPLPTIEFTRAKKITREVEVPDVNKLNFLENLKKNAVQVNERKISFSQKGLIVVDGIKCVLYIKNQSNGVNTYNKTSTYKYHICECPTIKSMIASGRKDRYVATNRDDGLFIVNVQNYFSKAKEMELELGLCNNCMAILKEKGIFTDNFNLKNYFKKHNSMIKTTFKKSEQVLIEEKYAPNQEEIAMEYKKSVHYICQICNINCSSHHELLHLHHKNGIGTDNISSNLMVLCIDCHMNQPNHGHMKRNYKFIEASKKIIELRKIQNIHTLK